MVNVTHDQREALMVSDRIALLEDGRIVQVEPGKELYSKPATRLVEGFLGDPLLLEGDIVTANGAGALHSWASSSP